MVTRHSPRQQFLEAFHMAKEHNCIAIERPHGTGTRYLLYRKPAYDGGRLVFVGSRCSIPAFRRFVESICHPPTRKAS